MTRLLHALLSIVFLAGFGSVSAEAAKPKPSFDCRKAKTDIEKQICAVPEYANLDRQIATLFAKALKALAPADGVKLKADQVKWLGERNDCIDLIHGDPVVFAEVNSCIGDALRKRAKELEAIVASGKLPDAAQPE
ncbi:MAG: lysozyme inhibitor LprI family protein [Hyphomicrobiales bacterium]